MAFIPVHESAGLYNQVNELMAPAGAASAANNVSINRDNVAECRAGFSNCSSGLPAGIPRQLYGSKDLLFCHINNQLWKQSGDCNWTRIGGDALTSPSVLWADAVYLYLATPTNIRRMRFSDLLFEDLAGDPSASGHVDGIGAAARFDNIRGISGDNQFVYVICGNHTFRKIDKITAAVTTIAGTPGAAGLVNAVGAAARFDVWVSKQGLTVNAGVAYVTDQANNRYVRAINLTTLAVSTFIPTTGIFFYSLFSLGPLIYVSADGASAYDVKIYTAGGVNTATLSSIGAYVATDGTSMYSTGAPLVETVWRYPSLTAPSVSSDFAGQGLSPGITDGPGDIARFQRIDNFCYGGGYLWVIDDGEVLRRLAVTRGLNGYSSSVTTPAGVRGNPGKTNGYGILPIIEP